MDSSLTPSFFRRNRDKLLAQTTSQLLIITANGILQKSADESYPFNQDPSFWYLTGINEPDLILVKTSEEEFIIIPKIYSKRQSVIDELDKDSLMKVSGINQIVDHQTGWYKIKGLIKKKQSYASLAPNPTLISRYGIYSNPARRRLVDNIKRVEPKAKLEDIRRQLAINRMVKQDVEVGLIKQAVSITTDTLKEILSADNLKKYRHTGQIEEDILKGFLSRGASGYAFQPIVASGPNTTLIHYDKLGQPLKNGDLIVCDVGSMYSFYKADITRTVIYGQPTKRQQKVFEAVKFVQSEAFKLLKPKVDYMQYEKQVRYLIGEQLIKLGLIKRINKKAVMKYYMTYCSHSLGLDTHDSADFTLGLSKNMVLTVEPGIYIKEEGLGVRLEDVVCLTTNGAQILSSNLPSSLIL